LGAVGAPSRNEPDGRANEEDDHTDLTERCGNELLDLCE
jgi:hypothetical protein